MKYNTGIPNTYILEQSGENLVAKVVSPLDSVCPLAGNLLLLVVKWGDAGIVCGKRNTDVDYLQRRWIICAHTRRCSVHLLKLGNCLRGI
jgi:hypothetical protein